MESFQGFGESLCFHLVSELAELVEIYAGPETERVGHGLYRFATGCLGRLAEPGADGPVDSFLEWNSELARPLLQESRQIVIDGERRSH